MERREVDRPAQAAQLGSHVDRSARKQIRCEPAQFPADPGALSGMPSSVKAVWLGSWPSSEIVWVASLSSLLVVTLTPESLFRAPAKSSDKRRCGEFWSMLVERDGGRRFHADRTDYFEAARVGDQGDVDGHDPAVDHFELGRR